MKGPRWQRVPVSEIAIPRAEAWFALAYAIGYVGLAFATAALIAHHPAPLWGATELTQDAWYALGFKIGLLLIVPVLLLRARGYRVADVLLGWRPTPRALITLAIAYGLGVAINAGLWSRIAAAATAPRVAVALLFALFEAGVPEELVFRYGLQTRLEKTLGRVAAILLTTILFTAWHLPTRLALAHGVEGHAGDLGSVLLGTGVPVAIVGLFFSLHWDRYRNLPVLIALHWGIDTLPITWSMLQLPPR